MADWSPEKYLAFATERARPALDLIARIPNPLPALVHDVGCGPGNSTRLLRQAFPAARITAIDASPAMIATAKAAGIAAEFEVGDVKTWVPDGDADLVFSNALFQWVPRHEDVLLRIFKAMKRGAILAVQMPDNLAEPSHRLMPETAHRFVRKTDSKHVLDVRSSLLTTTEYFDLFSPLADQVDIWRTTYHHRLKDHHAIAEMFSSTGLRPWLELLDPQSTDEFLEAYVRAITPHYAVAQDGRVIYPFPRLFILAVRA